MKIQATILIALCIGSTLSIGRGGIYNATYNFSGKGATNVDVNGEADDSAKEDAAVVDDQFNFTDDDFGLNEQKTGFSTDHENTIRQLRFDLQNTQNSNLGQVKILTQKNFKLRA
ncbi:MAG: hypothetical protein GY928_17155 [Colwellia sp.]|nr:hypothetical protein [Colwellia sp.]